MSKERLSLVAALATMVVWGMNFAFVKYVLERLGVGAFMFIRFSLLPLLGVVLLLLVFRGRIDLSRPRREDWPRFVAAALVGHTFHIAAVMYGMSLSTAFSSSLVMTSGPLFTLLILAAMGVERLRAREIAGTLVALCGMVLFLGEKFAGGLAHAGAGDLILLLAAFLFSLYTVLVRPLAERYGPLIVLSYTLLIGAPPILIVTLPSFMAMPGDALTPAVWAGLFWTLILSSFCGWLVWTWVNTVRGLARSAPLQYLMPPIAGIVAWLTLGETFTLLKIVGAAVTMGGIAWAQFGRGAQPDAG